jgi:hypothetical protein
MQAITVVADGIAIAVFIWLIYKAALPSFAARSRCRLLKLLAVELGDCAVRLGAELDRLAEHVRKGKVKDLSAAIGAAFKRLDMTSESGLPRRYQPAWLMHRIVTAKAAGDPDLAWDELRHWLRRVAFNWPHYLHVAGQATKLGLLFTVVGVFLAFANISQMSKPFEMFGALSLAMLTTIAGLVISLAVSHVLLQWFGAKLRALEIESEQVVLSLFQDVRRLQSQIQRVERRNARTKPIPERANDHGEARLRVAAAAGPSTGNGGVKCQADC